MRTRNRALRSISRWMSSRCREEARSGPRAGAEGLVVAVLPKAKPERAGMSFAEALLDLDGSEEEDEKDKGRKATRSKGSR